MARRRFVFIVEGDVFLNIAFDDQVHANAEGWVAGLLSDPKIIEVTDNPSVVPGWRWDGTNFLPPE